MPRLTNTEIVERLSGDNRTVVAFPDQSAPGKKVVVADVGPVGATYGLANAKTETAAAYRAGVDSGAVTDQITVQAGGGPTQEVRTKEFLRTQYFHTGDYDSTKVGFGAKRCFVNIQGQPLASDGTPTTVADAVDAETTPLGPGALISKPVTNYAQSNAAKDRTPLPGVYESPTVRQTALYAPYPGWTAQHDAPVIPHTPAS